MSESKSAKGGASTAFHNILGESDLGKSGESVVLAREIERLAGIIDSLKQRIDELNVMSR